MYFYARLVPGEKNPIVSAGQNFLKRGTFATVVKHNFLD